MSNLDRHIFTRPPKRTKDEIADWAPPHGYPRTVTEPRLSALTVHPRPPFFDWRLDAPELAAPRG